jgi:hypothetical protein
MYTPSGFLLDFLVDLIKFNIPVNTHHTFAMVMQISNNYAQMAKGLLIPSAYLSITGETEVNYFSSNASLHERIYLLKRNSWEKAIIYSLNTYFNVRSSNPRLTRDKVTGNFKISGIYSNHLPCNYEISSQLKSYTHLSIKPEEGYAEPDLVLRRIEPFNYGEYLDFLAYLKSVNYSDDPAITKYHLQTLDNIANFMLKFKDGNKRTKIELKLKFRETQSDIEDTMNSNRNVLKLD